jgi:hypothetical protein
MNRLALVFAIVLGISATAFADPIPIGDVTIALTPPAIETYPPGALAFECELDSGTTEPCVIFSGTITDFDTDGSLLFLPTDPTLSAFSNYFSVDNTFFNTPGVYEGDSADTFAPNTYGPGPIFGLDIAPGTPMGIYTAYFEFAGFGGDGDPNDAGFTVDVPFTVVIAPEPGTRGLTIVAGVLAIGASLRHRRSRAC